MSTYTPKLNLFKYDPINDAKQAFSIQQALNNNWDIIDSYLSNISSVDLSQYYTKSQCDSLLSSKLSPNSLSVVYTVIEKYVNGTSWYRVWSDGWIEQGGYVAKGSKTNTVFLLKNFSNTAYTILTATSYTRSAALYTPTIGATERTTSQFSMWFDSTNYSAWWYACGY